MTPLALALAGLFGGISLLAFGGGNSVLPEMQRLVVDQHHWMSAREFAALYALAQAAPGPNMMIVVLIGWRVGGLPGALASTIGMFGPSSIVAGFASARWTRYRDAPAGRVAQSILLPATIGLVAASAAILAHGAAISIPLAGIVLAATLAASWGRQSPLLVIAGGAALGLVFG